MQLRLHEIELGTRDVQKSETCYQAILGLNPKVSIKGLNVFDAATEGLDFNTFTHFPQGSIATSFFTDDLAGVEKRLNVEGISYESPSPSHLGMTSIQFKDPDGYLIKINTSGSLASE